MTDALVTLWESEIHERVAEEVNETLDDIVLELTQLRDGMEADTIFNAERRALDAAMDRIAMHKRGNGRE